jgi:hypothetical protein
MGWQAEVPYIQKFVFAAVLSPRRFCAGLVGLKNEWVRRNGSIIRRLPVCCTRPRLIRHRAAEMNGRTNGVLGRNELPLH